MRSIPVDTSLSNPHGTPGKKSKTDDWSPSLAVSGGPYWI